jgi:hypothetical protein
MQIDPNQGNGDKGECRTATCPEDFPALGLQTGDVITFLLVQRGGSVPERQPIVVRNVHTGDIAIGYREGDTLHLARQRVPRFFDWGAEVVGVVTTFCRRIDGQEAQRAESQRATE